MPRNVHIINTTSSAQVRPEGGSSVEDVSDLHWSLTKNSMPVSPEAHPCIQGQSDIHIPSMTHRIGQVRLLQTTKKDKNHIAWGSAKLLFHPIRVLNCWKLKGFPLQREHSPARKTPERYGHNNSWHLVLGNKRLDKAAFFWFVFGDIFKGCYSTDPKTLISIFTLWIPVTASHIQNMLEIISTSLVVLFNHYSLEAPYPLGFLWMDITVCMDGTVRQEQKLLAPIP